MDQEIYRVKKATGPLDIRVKVPGSKSITNRALLMAAMSDGKTCLKGVQFCEDSRRFLDALKDLGFNASKYEDLREVAISGMSGIIPKKKAAAYFGSAGTAARFLTAFCAMHDGEYTLDASAQMRKRPMKELLLALERLGARFDWLGDAWSFPMRVKGIGRRGVAPGNAPSLWREAKVELDIDESSQFLSALLMTAPTAFKSLEISLTGSRDARSYVEMTERMMKQFGHAGVERVEKDRYRVAGGRYLAREYAVEPDVSAACYFYAMAAVTGGSACVRYIKRDSLQGDMKFLGVLERMGCAVKWNDEDEPVLYAPADGKLRGVEADMADFSDQALTLAAIAPFADGPVAIRGIGHIRRQESNRIKVMVNELGRMNIRCDELEDGVIVYPGHPRPTTVKTYGDHRAAMAFTITGMAADGIEISDPMCCKKTFEGYFDAVDALY